MNEFLRAAFVVARRDFTATVFSRSFILFLVAPLFPVMVGLIFGSVAARGVADDLKPPTVAVIADQQEFGKLAQARDQVGSAVGNVRLVELRWVPPGPDPQAQRQRLLNEQPGIAGVLEGGTAAPRLNSTLPPPDTAVRQLQLIIDQARTRQAAPGPPIAQSVAQCPAGSLGLVSPNRALTARGAQGALFVLTIILATMLLSQLIEEKANKIIEVLAAAVPIGAMFLGKLLAMLCVSLLGIAVWSGAAALAFASLATGGLSAIPAPAVGWSAFLPLAVLYFAMSYLLLGSIFLSVGGHASSAREVQTLSMPVTMAQVFIFAIAALAIGEPNSTRALAAAAFPLSSPYVMIARAAELPELWPHLLAVAWQILWVAIILAVAARLFKRSVLKSGPAPKRGRKAAPAA